MDVGPRFDAGFDAGTDAGFDAGTDAGPPDFCEDIRDPLVAWYTMDTIDLDRVVDSSAYGVNASCVSPCPSVVSGRVEMRLK